MTRRLWAPIEPGVGYQDLEEAFRRWFEAYERRQREEDELLRAQLLFLKAPITETIQ
jgi:hypothetical protein